MIIGTVFGLVDTEKWFAQGPSTDKDQRLIDVMTVIGELNLGACVECGWRRVRAKYEYWETCTDMAVLADEDDPDPAPYSEMLLLCGKHTAERRARYPVGGLTYPARIRQLLA